MNSLKMLKMLKYFWLVITICGVILAVFFAVKQAWTDAGYFFILSLAGILFFNLRSKQLKRILEEESKK